MGTRKWSGTKASPVLFSKYLENSIKLGHTFSKFINIYGFKAFILIKQDKGNKGIYGCLGIFSITIQRVR